MNKIIFAAIVTSLALSTSNTQAQNAGTAKKHIEHAKAWEAIYEKDITFKKRNWSEIDGKAPGNKLFNYSRKSTMDVNLIDVLMNGIVSGRIRVFADERFSKQLTKDELRATLPKDYSPEKVSKYNLKEDRLTATTFTGMTERIVGLGPVMDDNKEPLFWVFYPEVRKVLADANVNCDEYDTPITWDDVMEYRLFTEHITRVSQPQTRKTSDVIGKTKY